MPEAQGRRPITAYIDGGARGNPGPAGFGCAFFSPDGTSLHQVYGYLGEQTNNYAEYSALVAALRVALRKGYRPLRVYADSELVVKQMNGEYRVKNKNLMPLFLEAQRLRRKHGALTLAHVPRDQNAEADRLANRGIDSRDSNLEETLG